MIFPQRKKYRLEGYDYSQNGLYSVTVCTQKKETVLSRVKNRDDLYTLPETELTDIGKITEEAISRIGEKHPTVEVENYCIMPDHIHLLLRMDDQIGDGQKRQSTLSSVVSGLKGYVTRTVGYPIWQKGFYDRIVRNDRELENIWRYIDTNPLRKKLHIPK